MDAEKAFKLTQINVNRTKKVYNKLINKSIKQIIKETNQKINSKIKKAKYRKNNLPLTNYSITIRPNKQLSGWYRYWWTGFVKKYMYIDDINDINLIYEKVAAHFEKKNYQIKKHYNTFKKIELIEIKWLIKNYSM